jgi:hypothetical protein
MLRAAEEEGEVSEELTFDNRKIGWSTEARNLLHEMPAGYLRRRIKAKVEKVARTRRLSVVTMQVAASLIEPELGRSANAQPHRTPLVGEPPEAGAADSEGMGFDDPSADAGEVDVALHTYAAGGVGGRYIPREASPTIARLRPREEGTTPGQGGQAADLATVSELATAEQAAPSCPFHGDAEAQERIVESMREGLATSDRSADEGAPGSEPAKCPFHGDSEAQDQIVASLARGPNSDS